MTRAQTAINKFLQRKGKGEGRWVHTLGRWWKRKRSTKNSLGKDVDPEQSAEVLGAPPPLPGVDAPYIWREKRSGIYRREEEDAPRFLAPLFLLASLQPSLFFLAAKDCWLMVVLPR